MASLSGLKVLCFAGRIHHWQRLRGVVQALREDGAQAYFLVSDNATNNDTAVEYLIPAGEQFVHALDYLNTETVSAVNASVAEALPNLRSSDARYTDSFSYVEPFWTAYSVREALEFLAAINNLLQSDRPDAVLILHEANFWGKMLAYACAEYGVPCLSFNEGLLRQRDQAVLGKFALSCEYSSRVLMWSEAARQAYIASGVPEDKLKVVGIPHLDEWFKTLAGAEGRSAQRVSFRRQNGLHVERKLVALCLPILNRFDGSPMRTIGLLADWSANTYTQLAIRFHPFEAPQNIERVKAELATHSYARVLDVDTIGLVAASDVVLSQHSTIAVEALALSIPLAEIDLDNAGVLESLVDQGVAVPIRSGDLDKITAIASGELRANQDTLAQWIDDHIGPRDGRSISRVLDVVREVVGR